ncbi:uroporphyrinogen-III synthase [Tardiphaga sp. 709]|uniref:uroporphyrinogen-III synthase n=1 Tax=Tardiphaga sp. 709 TaxID=3076039 RepID=UPI0028E7F3BB|nr:uroporphyrinogen-III synthase [Tardiphaga sp. 709]WNV07325.1 uroporphyrinogen-III synthase [Tardiphaga sp. 709]
MAILVTRPQPDNTSTAAALRARGFEVLVAPMLRFEKVMLSIDSDADFGAVIVTSANALRALADQPVQAALLRLPLFAVGDRTAEAARNLGFAKVISAEADAAALRDLLMKSSKNKLLNKTRPLLYLAGADLARDLAAELGARGFTVVTQTTYRMMPVADLPHDVSAAFVAGKVEAVLHYSRRSVRAFFQAVGLSGVEIAALAVPHYCLSAAVGTIAHDAGATQVVVAQTPDENALFAALDRAIPPLSR